MHSATSKVGSATPKGKFSGWELKSHHRTLFREAAMAGNFKPWMSFLSQGGDPKQLRNLAFPGGKSLRQVAENSNGDAVKLLKAYGLA